MPNTPIKSQPSSSSQTTPTLGRYVYAVVVKVLGDKPYCDDVFGLLNSAPINFIERYKHLRSELKANRHLIVTKPGHVSDAFSVLIDKKRMYNVMLGSSGIYCNLTERGDPADHDIYAPHIVITAIREILTGQPTRGVFHITKVTDNINAVRDMLRKLQLLQDHTETLQPTMPRVLAQLKDFSKYFVLHKKALKIVNKCAPDMELDSTLMPRAISPFVLQWNPDAMQHVTPSKPDASVYALRAEHEAYKKSSPAVPRSASASRPPQSAQPTSSAVMAFSAAAAAVTTTTTTTTVVAPCTPTKTPTKRGSAATFSGRGKSPRLSPGANLPAPASQFTTPPRPLCRQLFTTPSPVDGLANRLSNLGKPGF